MSFSRELDQAFEMKVEGELNKFVQKTAAKCLQAVVLGTPVGNPTLWQEPDNAPPGYTGGHARRNWLVDIDVVSAREVDGVDKAGSNTIRQGISEAERFDIKRNVSINLHNSAPYINRLNNGWSQQQPAGFVERAVQAASR